MGNGSLYTFQRRAAPGLMCEHQLLNLLSTESVRIRILI